MKYIRLLLLLLPVALRAMPYGDTRITGNAEWKSTIAAAHSSYKYILLYCYNNKEKAIDPAAALNIPEAKKLLESWFICKSFPVDTSLALQQQLGRLDSGYQSAENPAKAYPLLLFFSPDGKLVHKGAFTRQPEQLTALLREAIFPYSQYYTNLARYRSGIRDYPRLAELAVYAKSTGDKKTADTIATDFKKNYLDKLPLNDLATQDNINFISRFLFLTSSKDRYYDLAMNHAAFLDKNTYAGCSEWLITYFIKKEEINDRLWNKDGTASNTQDWELIRKSIREKYGGRYVVTLLPGAMTDFYRLSQNWEKVIETKNDQLRNNPIKRGTGIGRDAMVLNSMCWDAFMHCNNKVLLKQVIRWIDMCLALEPNNVQYLDTRANLLYKTGNTAEAITAEEAAIKQGIINAHRRGIEKGDFYDDFTRNLELFKKGEPTWPVQ